jgi:hypothetical protein
VREYATSLTEAISGLTLEEPLSSPLQPGTAVAMALAVLGVFLAFAITRLSRHERADQD